LRHNFSPRATATSRKEELRLRRRAIDSNEASLLLQKKTAKNVPNQTTWYVPAHVGLSEVASDRRDAPPLLENEESGLCIGHLSEKNDLRIFTTQSARANPH
jgi:hypothetical protein